MLPTKPLRRGLYAITPDTPDTDWLMMACTAVLQAGCPTLQYRDKISDQPVRLHRAKRLADLCAQFGADLIINDDLALALSVDAAGLHLGGTDGDLKSARAQLGPHRQLGASCYADLQRAQSAAQAGASYVAFGAMFASSTKPEAKAAPVSLLQAAKVLVDVPVCAIGGITLNNAPSVIAAGADQIAVISDLFIPGADAKTLTSRTRAFQSLFQSSLQETRHDLAQ